MSLYKITVNVGNESSMPMEFMVYAMTKPNAKTIFSEQRISCEKATDLEIVEHVKNNLPILGTPPTPDPNQTSMEI